MSVLKIVQPKLHALTGGLFANWLPNNLVEVGDYGILQNNHFQRQGSLREYGAEFDVEDRNAGKANLEYKDKVKVDFGASAGINTGVGQSAKVAVKMTDRGAFLYHLSKMKIQRPDSDRRFNEQIAAALINPALTLPEDIVLVTEVHHAGKATIIVADSNDCALDLQTSFAPGGDAFLSGVEGGVKAGNSRGSVFKFVAQDDMVTLLKVVRPTTPPAPGDPKNSAGAVAKSIEWIRTLIAERKLPVSTLSLTYVASPSQPHVVVAESNGKAIAQIVLADVTAEEMAAADEEDAGGEEIEVEEEEFGQRRATA
ncbi:MAG TPA: hypothetical protein VL101_14030 [Nordella sp.]|nr:hypothetical protein [Nordella sp.]